MTNDPAPTLSAATSTLLLPVHDKCCAYKARLALHERGASAPACAQSRLRRSPTRQPQPHLPPCLPQLPARPPEMCATKRSLPFGQERGPLGSGTSASTVSLPVASAVEAASSSSSSSSSAAIMAAGASMRWSRYILRGGARLWGAGGLRLESEVARCGWWQSVADAAPSLQVPDASRRRVAGTTVPGFFVSSSECCSLIVTRGQQDVGCASTSAQLSSLQPPTTRSLVKLCWVGQLNGAGFATAARVLWAFIYSPVNQCHLHSRSLQSAALAVGPPVAAVAYSQRLRQKTPTFHPHQPPIHAFTLEMQLPSCFEKQ